MGRVRQLISKWSSKMPGTQSTRYSPSNALCMSGNLQEYGSTDSPQVAIQSCRDAINVLNKQELSLQSQVQIAETEARALLRLGDRGGAETSLKKREIVLREIDRLHKTRMSLLSQILLVETASTRQVAVQALANGIAVHRKMSHRMFEDTNLEKLQDALLEQSSFETEISELLSQGFEAITNFDDDTVVNLKKSLSELEHDEVVNALAEANYTGNCSAESYQGTNLSMIRADPSAISFPTEPHSSRSVQRTSDIPNSSTQKSDDLETMSPTKNWPDIGDHTKNGPLASTLMTTMASPEVQQQEGTELWLVNASEGCASL